MWVLVSLIGIVAMHATSHMAFEAGSAVAAGFVDAVTMIASVGLGVALTAVEMRR